MFFKVTKTKDVELLANIVEGHPMIKEGQTGEVPEETGGRGGLMIDFIIYENRMPSNDKTIDENNTSG
ncbi:hypothetical protein NQZ68_016234, partial [Dissostichus eleginoides]